MPTLVIVRRPRTARSVTQTVRMRFLVGTEVCSGTIRTAGRCPGTPGTRHRTRRPGRWPGRLSSAGGDLPTGSRGPAETPERSPSGSAQLVRRGQASGGPAPMSLMRTYRRALGLSQSAFAAQLNVPLETYRPWDSGRREPPPQLLTRARTLAGYPDDTVLLPLPVLALMIGVHVRTLHAAACRSRIRHQAAAGSWTMPRQWEIQRTWLNSARAAVRSPAKPNGV